MPSPSHQKAGKQAQVLGCMVALAEGMQAHSPGPEVPCAPQGLSVDVEPDLDRCYSHLQREERSWPGHVQARADSCAHPAHRLLTLLCHPKKQERNKLC